MSLHWLIPCAHTVFIVDRIEPPYVIIEWAHSATFAEVPESTFPSKPREGQFWTVHTRKILNEPSYGLTEDEWISKEERNNMPLRMKITKRVRYKHKP